MSGYNGDGLAGPPLFDEEEFGDLVEERVARLPGIEDLERDGMELRFHWHGRTVVSELDHFYRAYRRSPDQLDAILEMLEKAIHSFAPDRGQQLWDELEDRIYPMFKPLELLVEVVERGLPQLVYRPFLADLIICYVVDEGESVGYVNEEHLKSWGVLESTLYNQALDNLRKRTLQPNMASVTGNGAQRLYLYATGDGYDAARLLLTDVLAEWAEHVPGSLVLGIPYRDVLVGFSDADREVLQRMALQIVTDSQRQEYSLTDHLFTIVGGRVEIYAYDWTTMQDDHLT